MAWEARSGLKHYRQLSYQLVYCRLNGLGSPFGIETTQEIMKQLWLLKRLNGLGSPFGIETLVGLSAFAALNQAKWPGKPVRD